MCARVFCTAPATLLVTPLAAGTSHRLCAVCLSLSLPTLVREGAVLVRALS